MTLPSWHQWISYETKRLDRDALASLIIDCIEHSIDIWEKQGVFSRSQAARERRHYADAGRLVIDEVNHAMLLSNDDERKAAIESLGKNLEKLGA